jgi:L-ascorbate metabolism protein UlaG (beta-lactamase superfamily)
MKLTFINHSSFQVQHQNVNLVIDPWLDGRVFNNGWDLVSKTQFSYEDFASVTHIWFSHEHPDHFFRPTSIKYLRNTEIKSLFCFKLRPIKES